MPTRNNPSFPPITRSPVTVDEAVQDLSPVKAYRVLQSLRLGQPDRNLTRLNSDHAKDIEHYIASQIASQSSIIKLLYGAFGTGKSTLTQIISDAALEQSVQCSLKTAIHSGRSPINQIHLWSMGTRNWIARVLCEISRIHTNHPTTENPGIEFDDNLAPAFRAFIHEYDIEPPGETLCSLIRIAAHSEPNSPKLRKLATEYTRAITTWFDSGRKKQLTELNRNVSVHGVTNSALTPQYDRHLSHELFRMHLAFYRSGNLYPLWIIDEFEAYTALRPAAINDVVDHIRDMVDLISTPDLLTPDPETKIENQSQAGGIIISTTDNGLRLIRQYKALYDRLYNERKSQFSTSDPTWHTDDYQPRTWKTATVTQYLLRLMEKASETDPGTAALYNTLSRLRHDPDVQLITDRILNDPGTESRVRIRSLLLDYYDRAAEGDSAFMNLTMAHKDAIIAAEEEKAAEKAAEESITESLFYQQLDDIEKSDSDNEFSTEDDVDNESTDTPNNQDTSEESDEFVDDFGDDFGDDLNDALLDDDPDYEPDDDESLHRAITQILENTTGEDNDHDQQQNREPKEKKPKAQGGPLLHHYTLKLTNIIADGIAKHITGFQMIQEPRAPEATYNRSIEKELARAGARLSLTFGLLDHLRPDNHDNRQDNNGAASTYPIIFTSPQGKLTASDKKTKPKLATENNNEESNEESNQRGNDKHPRVMGPGRLAKHINGLACAMTNAKIIQKEMTELSQIPLREVNLTTDKEARRHIINMIQKGQNNSLFELTSRPLRSVIDSPLIPDNRKQLDYPGQIKEALSIAETRAFLEGIASNEDQRRLFWEPDSMIGVVANLEGIAQSPLDAPTICKIVKTFGPEFGMLDVHSKNDETIIEILELFLDQMDNRWKVSTDDLKLSNWITLESLLHAFNEHIVFQGANLPKCKNNERAGSLVLDLSHTDNFEFIHSNLLQKIDRLFIDYRLNSAKNAELIDFIAPFPGTPETDSDIIQTLNEMKSEEDIPPEDARNTLLKAINNGLIKALETFEAESLFPDSEQSELIQTLRKTLTQTDSDRVDIPWLSRTQSPTRLSELRQQIYYFAFSMGLAPNPFSVDTLCAELTPNLSEEESVSPSRDGIGFMVRSSFIAGRKPKWTQVANTPLTRHKSQPASDNLDSIP